MTARQTEVLNLCLDGYEAKIMSPGAKQCPSYSIVYDAENLTQFFTHVSIEQENGIPYLHALFKGKKNVRERIAPLMQNVIKGGFPLSNLLSKYCSYIMAGI